MALHAINVVFSTQFHLYLFDGNAKYVWNLDVRRGMLFILTLFVVLFEILFWLIQPQKSADATFIYMYELSRITHNTHMYVDVREKGTRIQELYILVWLSFETSFHEIYDMKIRFSTTQLASMKFRFDEWKKRLFECHNW